MTPAETNSPTKVPVVGDRFFCLPLGFFRQNMQPVVTNNRFKILNIIQIVYVYVCSFYKLDTWQFELTYLSNY